VVWLATNAALPEPYPAPENWYHPSITVALGGATETMTAMETQVAFLAKTIKATYHRSIPWTPAPTGTVEGFYTQVTGGKVGVYTTINSWRGYFDGWGVNVFAGSEGPENPDQGKVCVIFFGQAIDNRCVDSPTRHGALRVVAEQNNRLTLISTDGTVYYFDVPAVQFVSDLNEILPTVTPNLPTNPYPGPVATATAAP
jgi:hypothetical protein